MSDDRHTGVMQDGTKILLLKQLLTDAWADPPMEGEAEYWRGILTAIGTIIEI